MAHLVAEHERGRAGEGVQVHRAGGSVDLDAEYCTACAPRGAARSHGASSAGGGWGGVGSRARAALLAEEGAALRQRGKVPQPDVVHRAVAAKGAEAAGAHQADLARRGRALRARRAARGRRRRPPPLSCAVQSIQLPGSPCVGPQA
jgi:hypothetical protein